MLYQRQKAKKSIYIWMFARQILTAIRLFICTREYIIEVK